MHFLERNVKRTIALLTALALLVTSVPISNFIVRAQEIAEENSGRPIYTKEYQDMFEGFTEDRIIMNKAQYAYKDKGAWSASTDEAGVVSLSYNTAEGSAGTEFSQVDTQIGYALSKEKYDYYTKVANKDYIADFGATWALLQTHSDKLLDLEKEDTYVYETDLNVQSIDGSGIVFNFRVPDFSGTDIWQAMRTGLQLKKEGCYLKLLNDITLASNESFKLSEDKLGKEVHLTILSSPTSVSVWLDDELIFDNVTFQIPEKYLVNGTCQIGSTVFPLNSQNGMVPNIGMYVWGASKFTISNQHLYLYPMEELVNDGWKATERNYYNADEVIVTYAHEGNTVDKTENSNHISISAQHGDVTLAQDLSDNLIAEDVVITELEYTPSNIVSLDWTNYVELNVAFRENSENTLCMKMRIAGSQTLLYFRDGHHDYISLANTNIIDGQKIRLTIKHSAEKVSVYMNGIPVVKERLYSEILNTTGNTYDFSGMQPVFKVSARYGDFELENISIRKENDTGGLPGISPLTQENSVLDKAEAITTAEDYEAFWKQFSAKELAYNESFVISALVKIIEEQSIMVCAGTYDGETLEYVLDGFADRTGEYIRLTTAVSPFGYDVYADGIKIYSSAVEDTVDVDYGKACYRVSSGEPCFLDVSVHLNSTNGTLYKQNIEKYIRPFLYQLQGVYHADKSEYTELVMEADAACRTSDSDNRTLKAYVGKVSEYYHEVLKKGKVVNNMVLDGSETKPCMDMDLDLTGYSYGGISLFEEGCYFKEGETWIFEADVFCTDSRSEQMRLGFGVYNYGGDNADIAIINNSAHYQHEPGKWTSQGIYKDLWRKDANWHVKYTVKPFECIQMQITRISDNELLYEYSVDWKLLGRLTDTTEETTFSPYFMFANVDAEISNLYIGYDLSNEVNTLNETLSTYQDVDVKNYTSESVSAYKRAMQKAQSVSEGCAQLSNISYSKSEIDKAMVGLRDAVSMLELMTAGLIVGGEDTCTTEVVYTATAGEELPTGYQDGKYVAEWTVDGKTVDTYDVDIEVDNYEAYFTDTKMLETRHQTRDSETQGCEDIRFISSVHEQHYKQAGFVFSALENPTLEVGHSDCLTVPINYGYKSVYADGVLVDISGAGYDDYSQYMFVCAVTGIPYGATLYARAYVQMDNGDYVYGEVHTVTAENPGVAEERAKAEITELFHDQGDIYLTPEEPKSGEKISLRLRTEADNVKNAQIQYVTGKEENLVTATEQSVSMTYLDKLSIKWGTSQVYKEISLFDGNIPLNTDDTWVVETDITASDVLTAEARVALKLYTDSSKLTTMIQNSTLYGYNVSSGAYDSYTNVAGKTISIYNNGSGGTWHFKYTITGNRSLRTEVFDTEGTKIVDFTMDLTKARTDGTVYTFNPKLIFTNGDYTCKNIYVYKWQTADMACERGDCTGYYDIWKGDITATGELLYYRFVANNNAYTVHYDTYGISSGIDAHEAGWKIVPGNTTPTWAKGALIYSLMPDAFYNGNTTNDKQESGLNSYVTWNKVHKNLGDKYGGDLDGVEKKLEYLSNLYVDAIYMNPLQKSYQNAGYEPIRYDEIDSSFGNEQDLKTLAEKIHNNDMKLIGDVVLFFAQEESYYYNEAGLWPVTGVVQNAESSEWNSLFAKDANGNYIAQFNGLQLNLLSDSAKKLLYQDENSYLLHYAKIFDGYRFDCGGWLGGYDEGGNEASTETVVKKMRDAIQTVNNDFYMVAESDYQNLTNQTWDGQWNLQISQALADYANGEKNEKELHALMEQYLVTLPRNVALCTQNMLATHDTERVNQKEDYMYNAAALVQMTYLGSPSVYYGEEVALNREVQDGIGSSVSFYAMEWDESNWDKDRLNFYKATGELRQRFTCIKTGAVNTLSVDSDNNVMVFGRWDSNGTAVTIASQNDEVVTLEIPVKKLNVKNGTIMTDWYTGKQYVVEDGKITANVIPGGTVIVTGEESSSYLCNASYTIRGEGNLGGYCDDIRFAHTSAHNGFSVEATLEGNGAFLIRNGVDANALCYGVVLEEGKLSVVARKAYGERLQSLVSDISYGGQEIRLQRTGENRFVVYVDDSEVVGATVYIGMNNEVQYGVSPLNGEMTISGVVQTQLESQVSEDDFGRVNTAMLDNMDAESVSIANGKLTIGNSTEENTSLLTNAADDDWTCKAKVKYCPTSEGAYAGVVCQQDEDNYIVAGYGLVNGKQQLFLGKYMNGALLVTDSVEVTSDEVVIQLQRIGAYYSAVYSSDNEKTWHAVGKVFTNYSRERVGLLVKGMQPASVDWLSMGNTPCSPGNIVIDSYDTSGEASYEFLSGEWSLITGGWHQGDVSEFSQASATNKEYESLYAETTVHIASGNGWAGLGFGKASAKGGIEDGFYLQYFKDGTLQLVNASEVIAKTKLGEELWSEDGAMRLVIHASDNGDIVVYAGQDVIPVLQLSDTGYSAGYVSLCTDGAEADFLNIYHGAMNGTWTWVSGRGGASGNDVHTSYEEGMHSVATLAGYGFTDFICTAGLMATEKASGCKSGLHLCASQGKTVLEDGVYVYIDSSGKLHLSVMGIDKDSYSLPSDLSYVEIMVVKQNQKYQVFLAGDSVTPVLEYTDNENCGGVISAYTINGEGVFANITISHLQAEQDYRTTEVYQNWSKRSAYDADFSDNFDTISSMDNYFLYRTGAGTLEVKNGYLSCTAHSDFSAGATVLNGKYSDFRMKFSARLNGGYFMQIGLRKQSVAGDHNSSNLTLLVEFDAGKLYMMKNGVRVSDVYTIPEYMRGSWYDYEIIASGDTITVLVDETELFSYTDATSPTSGYISIAEGICKFDVDNLAITPINN